MACGSGYCCLTSKTIFIPFFTLHFNSVNPGQLACWVLKAFSADHGKEGTARKTLGRPSCELFTLGPCAPGSLSATLHQQLKGKTGYPELWYTLHRLNEAAPTTQSFIDGAHRSMSNKKLSQRNPSFSFLGERPRKAEARAGCLARAVLQAAGAPTGSTTSA